MSYENMREKILPLLKEGKEYEVQGVVSLKDLLKEDISVEDGKDIRFPMGLSDGKAVFYSLKNAPHMLIAGCVASGKSIFLHQLIVSLISKYSPEQLKLILVDPKCVEFNCYATIPHLGFNRIFNDYYQIFSLLEELMEEAHSRRKVLKKHGVNNIDEYNELAEKNEYRRMKKLVVIFDEFADLMEREDSSFENYIFDLTIGCAKVGIHFILATQRASEEIITPLIKNNMSCRLAFRLTDEESSVLVLNSVGATKLKGWGDMLFKCGDMISPKRAQGPYINASEIRKVIEKINEETK